MAKRPVEVEASDPFLEAFSKALDWVLKNKLLVIGGLVAFFVVMAAAAGWVYHRSSYEKRGGLAFARALRIYRGLPPQAKADDVEQAVRAFRVVVKEYSNSKWASFAHLYVGKCYSRMGKGEDAVREYALGVQGIRSEKYFWPQWLTALALAREPDKGIDTLKEGLRGEKPFLEPYLRYNLALLYQEKGDLDKAVGILEDLRGRFPSSPFGMEAQRLLEVLR
ncbi:MAG: hypothetical protein DRI92_03100 [Aquificota bacterium]|nr:MAG: hypothetical protein DRI92_03100 [Aquificota bacterium]